LRGIAPPAAARRRSWQAGSRGAVDGLVLLGARIDERTRRRGGRQGRQRDGGEHDGTVLLHARSSMEGRIRRRRASSRLTSVLAFPGAGYMLAERFGSF
jgi:hypothetical protein